MESIKETGKAYLEQAGQLEAEVKKLRPQLHILKGQRLLNLQKTIKAKLNMAAECRNTGMGLLNYYED